MTNSIPKTKRSSRWAHHASALVAVISVLGLAATAAAQDGGTPGIGEGEVLVTPSVVSQVPIAVADARSTDGTESKIGKDIGEILRRDFKISGAFEIVDPGTFLPGLADEGLAAAETNYANWYSSGAEAVVKATYRTSGSSLDLEFRLYDAVNGAEVRLRYEAPAATPEAYRQAAHAFANAVIEHYTGYAGIFGQELLVTRKSRTKGEVHVYRVGTDGGGLSKVSSGNTINMLPSWGPGGSVIYTSYASGNPDLVSSDGTRISTSSGLNSGGDYCSGNGKVALTLSKDDNPEIYTVNADGSGLTRLTQNGYIDTSPSWSPDCSRLAFVSNRGGSPQIYVMSADGSGASLVTTAGSYNTSPSWAPGGSKIAFTARDEFNVFDIFVVDADSGFIERLTQDQGHNEEPTWSPDGRYLAFTSTRDGGSKLYIMTADGRFQTAITEGSGYETPTWSR